ncbi:hypothetical protein CHH83_01300 [Bacillus sp. 7586-K]|nr:hypothetical protein CHH83_01300 [Bacillus sp. 7586-K]
MNIERLFEVQKVLRDRIAYNNPDKFNKLILALVVEIGECANEWREFKFWSKDQEPRTWQPNEKDICKSCNGSPIFIVNGKIVGQCEDCDGCGVHFHNPLLEEYVDGLHFVLEIGLELNYTNIEVWTVSEKSITNQFIECIGQTYNLYFQMRVTGEVPKVIYENLVATFLGLGEMLGFSWEQIEQAYMDKNKVNHQRQDNGY